MQGTSGTRPRGRMVSLGRVTAPKPVNLPSQKRENNGNDPNIPLVPKAVSSSVWGGQAGQDAPPVQAPPQHAPPQHAQPAQGQPGGAAWGGAGASDRRQAGALLAQDEFPTLGAPAVEALPNGAPYGHAPQGFANGIPPSHPPMDRAAWDRPASGPSHGKAGSPAEFHGGSAGSWGAPSTGERWADSAPMRGPPPGQGYGPPAGPYGAMDARMDIEGAPYMPAQGGGFAPFNQPPPPPPRARPPSAPIDHTGPRVMAGPPEYPPRPQQPQQMAGPGARGHGQYEGHGQMPSDGAGNMAGAGYLPPHLRNRERPEGGMTRPGSEWSIAAQPSESLPDEAPVQATPPKILRRDLPAIPPSVPRGTVQPQQGHVQQHAASEGHHRSSHGGAQPHPQPAMVQHPPMQPHYQQRSHGPQATAQGPPVLEQGHPGQHQHQHPQQKQPPPPPPQQQHLGAQRLQFGQLGSPPGYGREPEGRPLQGPPAALHLLNGHSGQQQGGGPMSKLQREHSAGGQGFSPKVAQTLGLNRAASGPESTDGQPAQANGPITTFGQSASKPQHQPASLRTPTASEAATPKVGSAGAAPAQQQPAAMSELQAQKAYMRQKVQQRQQEAKLQQQAAAGRQRSASEASKHSTQQSSAQLEPSGQPEQPRVPMASGPGRGQGRQGPGSGGRGQEAGRGRGRRDMQQPRSSEAQAAETAVPLVSPAEQLIMEDVQAKMRSMSMDATRGAVHSGPAQQRQHPQRQHPPHQHPPHQHPQQQQQPQQPQQQQAQAQHEGAPAGAEGGQRRPSAARDGQPKAVPIASAARDSSSRRDAAGAGQQRRPAVPIAVPMPDKKAAAEGRPQQEGQGPQRERGGPREKRGRERGALAAGEATPKEPNQAPISAQHASPLAADAGLAGAQGAEQRSAGPPGVNRRGARSGRTQPGPRGERPAAQGVQSKEASVAEAVDAPPGLAAEQQQQEASQAPGGVHQGTIAKPGDQSSPALERRERHDRAPRGGRRERGGRDRPPRPAAATTAGAAPDSDAATEGKGSEPAEAEAVQSGLPREGRRRAGERPPKKPRGSSDASSGQQIQAPPGLGGPSPQNAPLADKAPAQGSRRERAERELYHPPVKDDGEPAQGESQAEASAEAPLQMTDGKPPGLGRARQRHGRERRERRRPASGAPDKAADLPGEDGPAQEGGPQPQKPASAGSQPEEDSKPTQQRERGPRSSGRGSQGRGRAGAPAPADNGQDRGSSSAAKAEAPAASLPQEGEVPQEGLPQRSGRSGRGRGPRGGARGSRSSQDGAPADTGEGMGSDGEPGKVRTLEVARGGIDAKGKRVWAVKDGPAGSQAAGEKPSSTDEAAAAATATAP